MTKKHQEHIVCISSDHVKHRAHGFVDYELDRSHIMLGQRAVLEQDDRFRQLLPVAILLHDGKIWAYRRAPSGGETRLHGLIAVAIGGHFDACDVVLNDSVVDIETSIDIALRRELSEEIDMNVNITRSYTFKKALCADDTEVDRLHMAIVNVYEVDGNDVKPSEDALENLGFVTPESLLDGDQPIEAWTKYICQLLVDNK